MTRKLNVILLVLLIVVGMPFAWLMLDATGTGADSKPIPIAMLRQLAGNEARERPIDMRYEQLGYCWAMSDLLAAGSGLRPVPIAIRAYELVFADGRIITVDRGLSLAVAKRYAVQAFDPAAQLRVDRAIAASSEVLLLSPDVRHSGRENLPAERELHRRPYPVAPGVVVIPVDAQTPGKRMIYVRLADGRELLLAGDVAPIHAAWEEQRPPARLATLLFGNGDRHELAAWLRTIDRWRKQAPALHIVSGHDEQVPRVVKRGFVDRPRDNPSPRP